MALLIDKDEAMNLLRQNRKHYLWLKNFTEWTEQDVQNLRRGNNINVGNIMRDKVKNQGQPVLARKAQGEPECFPSVVIASKITGVPESAIYATVNGRPGNCREYEFVKI